MLPSPPKPLKPYTPTLNGNFIKAGDYQLYCVFLEPRYDLKLKKVLLGFELFFNCDIRFPKEVERNMDWILTD